MVDAFVDELDLRELGFEGADPAATGRPSYHPAVLLKLYIYGYLNRIPSSRRLEREAQRNVELMWLIGRLAPDFKTIADFRHDNGEGIRNVCRRFVQLCRELKLFTQAIVAVDSSKFKAVNSRDHNFTPGKVDKRQEQIEQSIRRVLRRLARHLGRARRMPYRSLLRSQIHRNPPEQLYECRCLHVVDELLDASVPKMACNSRAARPRTRLPRHAASARCLR